MATRKTISDEQLLQAALAVFKEQGVSASTQDIARRAGTSEALLFKRFGSRDELFTAAMRCAVPPPWVQRLDAMRGTGDVRENMVEIATGMIEFMRSIAPRMVMSWSARCDIVRALGADAPPVRSLKALANWFDAEMRAGRMRPRDPEVVARIFGGAVFHHVFLEMMGVNEVLPLPDATFVRGLIESLWSGLEPEPRAEKAVEHA